MSGEIRAGWAIRRDGRCPPNSEVGHGTWGSWWACCPVPTDAWAATNNNTRCDQRSVQEDPPAQCANSTWSLWYREGYFCCEHNQLGYYYEDNSVGCATKSVIDKGTDNNTMWTAQQEYNPPGVL